MNLNRKNYINKLLCKADNNSIKIVWGMVGCGKSYLLRKLLVDELLESGVFDNHIIYLSFNDIVNDNLCNPLELYKHLKSLINDGDDYYLILDGVEYVYPIVQPKLVEGKIIKAKKKDELCISFIDVVKGLSNCKNVNLFIGVEDISFIDDVLDYFNVDVVKVLPFTPFEIRKLFDEDLVAYNEYFKYGGLPIIYSFNDNDSKIDSLRRIYTYDNLKIKKDFNLVLDIVGSNLGNVISPSLISNYKDINLGRQTVYNYLNVLGDKLIISKIQMMDIKKKKVVGGSFKYYFSDIGICNLLDNIDDYGKYQNIIYNELLYYGFEIYFGLIERFTKNEKEITVRKKYEVDFIVKKLDQTFYIQCVNDVSDEDFFEKKNALLMIKDSFRKIIIVNKVIERRYDENGILIIGINDFLFYGDFLV